MPRQRLTITLSDNLIKKLDKKIDGRIIRNRSHAIESFLAEKLQNKILKKAIILGGGRGLNLNGKITSKLLLPVGNKTLLEANIGVLRNYGIDNLILAIGKYGNQIREKFGDGSAYDVKINYFERDIGTASVLRRAKSLLEEETFLMMNGDIFLGNDIDLEDMREFHKSMGGKATILLTTSKDVSKVGGVSMKGNIITKFSEKAKLIPPTHLINAGVYLLEPEVCDLVTHKIASMENDVFPKLVKEKSLFGYSFNGEWIHLHNEEDYKNFLKISGKKEK